MTHISFVATAEQHSLQDVLQKTETSSLQLVYVVVLTLSDAFRCELQTEELLPSILYLREITEDSIPTGVGVIARQRQSIRGCS